MSKRDKQGNLHSEETGRFISKTTTETKDGEEYYVILAGAVAEDFPNPDTKHHRTHRDDMGFKGTKEYVRAAIIFFNSDNGKLYYSRARGYYYRYDEKTKEFASCSAGSILTYYLMKKNVFERTFKQDDLEELIYERKSGVPCLRYRV